METNIKVVGFANQSFNGKNITNKGIHINYDGKQADINAFDNGKMYYMNLDNDDIKDILNKQSSQLPLETRLINDFELDNIKIFKKPKNAIYFRKPTPYYYSKKHNRKSKGKLMTKNKYKNIHTKPTRSIKTKGINRRITKKTLIDPIDQTIF
jgi:hypothetical protein